VKGSCAVIAFAAALCLAACSSSDNHRASGTATSPGASRSADAAGPATPRASNIGTGHASPGAAPESRSVTIAAVGDTMLGNTPDLPPDPEAYFDQVGPILGSGAQIVFGNLEGTLTTSTISKCGSVKRRHKNCFAFRDPPGYARYLKRAGFTILNDANNHSFDFGATGQAQTVRAIHAAGLAQTGLPGEITEVRANAIKVAFVAFAPYSYDADLLDLPAARALIAHAARDANVVVVYMHAGAEGSTADHVTTRRRTTSVRTAATPRRSPIWRSTQVPAWSSGVARTCSGGCSSTSTTSSPTAWETSPATATSLPRATLT
jgi:hypothetical protein